MLNDFLTATESEYVMQKIKRGPFARHITNRRQVAARERDKGEVEEARRTINGRGCFPVENYMVPRCIRPSERSAPVRASFLKIYAAK